MSKRELPDEGTLPVFRKKAPEMRGVTVRPVETARDLETFIHMPRLVYRDDPHWIAPLDLERKETLRMDKNPYFEHAEARLFLAFKAQSCVGRISAQIDQLYLGRHGDRTGHFGFLEAVDDRDVFAGLLTSAQSWLARHDMTRVRGPFSFSINEETGLLIDGFDTPPSVMMGHARPYYAERLSECGYTKAKDVIAYDYNMNTKVTQKQERVLQRARHSHSITIRPLSKRHLDRDLGIIITIFNDAWSHNWGFVPMTEAEIEHLGRVLRLLVREEFIAIAEIRGEPAAMAVTLPNVNDWIADLDGRLMPFGWVKLLRRFLSPPRSARLPLMGVRKAYQGTLVGPLLTFMVIDTVRQYHLKRGLKKAELSWVLEDNTAMRCMIEAFGARAYKTYRIYERAL